MRKNKPFGFWKEKENVKQGLERVAKKLKHFPSWIDLEKIGEYTLIQAIRNYHGGSLVSFRDEMGYEPKKETKPEGFWQRWNNFKGELEDIIDEIGHFPSGRELAHLKRFDICNAANYYGGMTGVRKRFGYTELDPHEIGRQTYIRRLEERLDEPLEDFLLREYVENHRSIDNIAKEVGSAQHTVKKWLEQFKIPIRTVSESRLAKGVKRPSKRELKKLYVIERKSTFEIAEETNVSNATVSKWLKEEGIPFRNQSERSLSSDSYIPSKSELKRDYEKNGLSQRQIAEKYELSIPFIVKLLDEHGIKTRTVAQTRQILRERYLAGLDLPSREKLERLYIDQNKSLKEIAEGLELSVGTIRSLRRQYSLRRRNLSKDYLKPSISRLRNLYEKQRMSLKSIGEEIGVSTPVVVRWLNEYEIPIRGIQQASLARWKSGVKIPTKSELERWYVKEGKTTVEIGERLGVSNQTVGHWLKNYGIETRDNRGIYDEVSYRRKTMKELLRLSGKRPQYISVADFQNTKGEEDISFSGLLGWYRRNFGVKQGEARDLLLEELCGIAMGKAHHSNRAKLMRLEQFKDWQKYDAAIQKMFDEHPELDNKLPSSVWMHDNKYGYLALVATKYHGGLVKVREKSGQPALRRDSKYVRDFENIRKELEEIMEKNKDELKGRFPRSDWLNNNGYSFVANAITRYHGGFKDIKKKLGYKAISQIKTDHQLTEFLRENNEAGEIASLASVSENTGEIANLLVQLWPDRFPSAAQLAKSLPSAVKHIGHSLHPFSMEKARGIYEKTKSLPAQTRYVLEDLLYSIAVDQYQVAFNNDPEETLSELRGFSSQKNGVKGLARKVLDYYESVYEFTIPGYGKVKGVA